MIDTLMQGTNSDSYVKQGLSWLGIAAYAVTNTLTAGGIERHDRLWTAFQRGKIGVGEFAVKSIVNSYVSAIPFVFEVLTTRGMGSLSLAGQMKRGAAVGAGGSVLSMAVDDGLNWALFGDSPKYGAEDYVKAALLGGLIGGVSPLAANGISRGIDWIGSKLRAPSGTTESLVRAETNTTTNTAITPVINNGDNIALRRVENQLGKYEGSLSRHAEEQAALQKSLQRERSSQMQALRESGETLGMADERSKGYVSGYKEIIARARAAKAGDVGAKGEIEAAKALREEGANVHFQTPVGRRGPNTADFLVGGEKGTGVGGIANDVFTPITEKPPNVLLGIAKKSDQSKHIIVNLRHTKVRSADLGDIMKSLSELSASSIKSVKIIE